MKISYPKIKSLNFKLANIFFALIMFAMIVGMKQVAYAENSDTDVQQLMKQAVVYYQSGQFDKGLEPISKVIEIDSGNKLAYVIRGEMYVAKDMYDRSISDFSKALEIDPQYVVALVERGQAYSAKSKMDQAMIDFNRALEIDPQSQSAFMGRGLVYISKGMNTKAKSDFNSFFKYANPDDPRISIVKKWIAQFGLNNINTVELEMGNVTMNNLLLQGVRNNDVDMVQTAISGGANVNIYTDHPHYGTPFTIALDNSNLTMINFLIAQGADIDVKLFCNRRPLMFAVNSSQALDFVPLLIGKGANVNAEDQGGNTALTYVINGYSANKANIVQILLNNGANVNHTTNDGTTYLIQAIGHTSALDVVKILLYAGADPNKIDSSGKKALDYAIGSNNKEIINLLLPITQTR